VQKVKEFQGRCQIALQNGRATFCLVLLLTFNPSCYNFGGRNVCLVIVAGFILGISPTPAACCGSGPISKMGPVNILMELRALHEKGSQMSEKSKVRPRKTQQGRPSLALAKEILNTSPTVVDSFVGCWAFCSCWMR